MSAPIRPTSKMLMGIVLAVLLGCAPTHPITSGFVAPTNQNTPGLTRVVVWSSDPKLEPILLSWVQDHGGTVIDPSRVQEVVTQEHITLSPSPTVEQDLVRVARLVGAEQVLVAAVTMESHPVTWMYAGHKEGGERVNTLYDPSVTVRSLNGKTGEIRWTVSASGQGPVFVPARAIIELTETALKRATCETEPGHEWQDDSGCIDKQ